MSACNCVMRNSSLLGTLSTSSLEQASVNSVIPRASPRGANFFVREGEKQVTCPRETA